MANQERSDLIRELMSLKPGITAEEARDLLVANGWVITRIVKSPPPPPDDTNQFIEKARYQVGQSSGPRPDMQATVDELIKMAAEENGGAEPTATGGSQAFFGTGRRLGHTEQESPAIAATLREEREATVSFYKNGYVIDESGVLQSYDTPNGRSFFAALKEGRVPEALAAAYPNADVSLRVRNEMQEEFTARVPFQGEGRRLDGGKEKVAMRAFTYDRNGSFDYNEAEASTVVRIVNTFAQQKEFKVNPNRHTVEDLYYLAHTYQPAIASFDLVTRDRPPRTLDVSTRPHTIAEEKLERSIVSMRPA